VNQTLHGTDVARGVERMWQGGTDVARWHGWDKVTLLLLPFNNRIAYKAQIRLILSRK